MLWQDLERPIIALAPMYGVTDSAFRLLCKEFGADVVFSEMQVADSIFYTYKKRDLNLEQKIASDLKFEPKERPIIFQLAGNNPDIVTEAAKIIIDKFSPDGIDFNLGCPAKSARKNLYGASLLNYPKNFIMIVKKLRKSIKVPLSVKLRSGVEKDENIIEIAKILEKEGVDLISVHGRTAKQGYKGNANWQIIYRVAETIKIPVLGSGNMLTAEKVVAFLKNPFPKGVLIARGAIGHPQIFSEVKSLLKKERPKEFSKIEILKKHALLAWKKKQKRGIRELRKHLKAYLSGIPENKYLRLKLMEVEELDNFLKILNLFLDKNK